MVSTLEKENGEGRPRTTQHRRAIKKGSGGMGWKIWKEAEG